ncbi:MAG: FGGY-family carbohydrate kinase [Granulosicoccus sp.]
MSHDAPLFAGIDLGTSGVRGVCVDEQLQTCCSASVVFDNEKDDRRDPQLWWLAVKTVLRQLTGQVAAARIVSIAVDGTSGTMIAVNETGEPMGDALLYNDPCHAEGTLEKIAMHAPASSAVHGATSGLARAISLTARHSHSSIMHEADWIAFKLTGLPGISDENNALKTGYDPIAREWPAWIDNTGIFRSQLPRVVPAGQLIAPIHTPAAKATGLDANTRVVAGTTDGCASFLATGAASPGDGVTVLGSTLTIKLLSDSPLCAPEYGIYSHRIGDAWLAGGASNTGGNVLAKFFQPDEIESLCARIDTSAPSALDYYPLPSPGERFPINDSHLEPRLSPRPNDDSLFLYGILDGIAKIEVLAYQRLRELGAPVLQSVRTVGGGAHNATWTAIRQQHLNVQFPQSDSAQAAVGTARLARNGYQSETLT